MRVFILSLSIFLLTGAASAQQCAQCALTDACIKEYTQATAKIKKDYKKGAAEQQKGREQTLSQRFSERAVLAGQGSLDSAIAPEIDKLKDCLSRVK